VTLRLTSDLDPDGTYLHQLGHNTRNGRRVGRERLVIDQLLARFTLSKKPELITFREIVGSLIYHGRLTIGSEHGGSGQHQELPIIVLTCTNTTGHHDPIRLSAP
jgi:hypothetical protein